MHPTDSLRLSSKRRHQINAVLDRRQSLDRLNRKFELGKGEYSPTKQR